MGQSSQTGGYNLHHIVKGPTPFPLSLEAYRLIGGGGVTLSQYTHEINPFFDTLFCNRGLNASLKGILKADDDDDDGVAFSFTMYSSSFRRAPVCQ